MSYTRSVLRVKIGLSRLKNQLHDSQTLTESRHYWYADRWRDFEQRLL